MGIDKDPACIAKTQSSLKPEGRREFRTVNIFDPAFMELAGMSFDSVIFGSSLEEMPDDTGALTRAREILKPSGTVVVLTAAIPLLAGELDRTFHARRYWKRELKKKMTAAGLRIELLRYVNLLGAIAWWWDSRVLRRRAVPSKTYASRDRWIPLARLLDRLTGPPIGRSLLAVGRKT